MKVIEKVRNERTGEIKDVSWGNNITSDMGVMASVASIMDSRIDQNDALFKVYGRETTISITIEL